MHITNNLNYVLRLPETGPKVSGQLAMLHLTLDRDFVMATTCNTVTDLMLLPYLRQFIYWNLQLLKVLWYIYSFCDGTRSFRVYVQYILSIEKCALH